MDRIMIYDLHASCIIGIRDEERLVKQEVLINLALHCDLAKSCRSDRIEDTVDYCALKKQILSDVEQSEFFLVEALAQRVADICLEYPKVEAVEVQAEKPSALRFARSVGVRLLRERNEKP